MTVVAEEIKTDFEETISKGTGRSESSSIV